MRGSAWRGGLPWTTAWVTTTRSRGSSPGSATSTPTWRPRAPTTSTRCFDPAPPATDEGDHLLHHEALVTVFDLRLLEPELRPAAAMVCTETVWAVAARNPRPRLLVVDEVWSIMQRPRGAAFMVSMAKRARKQRLGLQFITQDVQDLLSEDTSRAGLLLPT